MNTETVTRAIEDITHIYIGIISNCKHMNTETVTHDVIKESTRVPWSKATSMPGCTKHKLGGGTK